ncbi:MAG: hypothetical protein ACE15C_09375 [Phycisphaerae bacterium]
MRSSIVNHWYASGEAQAAGWITRPGVRLKQVGNYWIKEVNPESSAPGRWYGRGSIEAQSKALDALGEMAPSHLFTPVCRPGSTTGRRRRGRPRITL